MSRASKLERIEPNSDKNSNEYIFGEIAKESPEKTHGKFGVWVDLNSEQAIALEFLKRLNERRHWLETRFRRPLILCLPLNFGWEATQACPDLWSIRGMAWEISLPLDLPNNALAAQKELPSSEKALADTKDVPEHLEVRITAWLTAIRAKPSRSLIVEGAQLLTLVEDLNPWKANGIAQQILAISRSLSGNIPSKPENREALRDLSVSLNKLGDTESALGQFDLAKASYQEGLQLSRTVLERFGENREALRDHWVSLMKLGDTESALGQFDLAKASYQEGLQLRRTVLARFGENREALRDLSVSLNKLGDTESALGQFDLAKASYQEGLQLSRTVLERFGENREALRDHWVSLMKLGDTESALGQFDLAKASYQEGLQLRRTVLERFGENREALRDLLASLQRINTPDSKAEKNALEIRLKAVEATRT